MPYVTVRYGHSVVLFRDDHDKARAFGKQLQETVARNLDCPEGGGDLAPTDVDVSFATAGMHDLQAKDVVVTIMANHFETRAENADERLQAIAQEVRDWLKLPTGMTIGFWLLMPESVWLDFTEP